MSVKPRIGSLSGADCRIGIVMGRFNSFITDRLLDGAVGALTQHGVPEESIDCVAVPGALEIPVTAKVMASKGGYDGLVAIGCVIRGATPHFEYVAAECTRGLQSVSLDLSLPIGFGVLTVDTLDQAIERAGSKAGNKGAEAALAVLETLNLLRELRA